MLLCVGCRITLAFPQDFDSPLDLVSFSYRALDDFGQVHLIPERSSGAGLQACSYLVPDCNVRRAKKRLKSGGTNVFIRRCGVCHVAIVNIFHQLEVAVALCIL